MTVDDVACDSVWSEEHSRLLCTYRIYNGRAIDIKGSFCHSAGHDLFITRTHPADRLTFLLINDSTGVARINYARGILAKVVMDGVCGEGCSPYNGRGACLGRGCAPFRGKFVECR